MGFALAFLLCLPAFGAESTTPITDTNSVQALRNIEAIAGKSPVKLNDPELGEWVRARFAWVALLRLEGKTEQARRVFEGCGTYCAKHGPSSEWKALKAWGCGRKSQAEPCK